MDENTFKILGSELQQLSKTITLKWGKVQNDDTDSKIDLFSIQTLEQLDIATNNLNTTNKAYFKTRWFVWQCSKIDEYLFYKHKSVKKNPDAKSQDYDVEFLCDRNIKLDIKGTVVPKVFRKNFNPKQEQDLIAFYYNKQSKGIRFHMQNRLFVVHHSFKDNRRSKYLRCFWDLKAKAYNTFINTIDNIKFHSHNGVLAKCLFILESKEGEFYYHIN